MTCTHSCTNKRKIDSVEPTFDSSEPDRKMPLLDEPVYATMEANCIDPDGQEEPTMEMFTVKFKNRDHASIFFKLHVSTFEHVFNDVLRKRNTGTIIDGRVEFLEYVEVPEDVDLDFTKICHADACYACIGHVGTCVGNDIDPVCAEVFYQLIISSTVSMHMKVYAKFASVNQLRALKSDGYAAVVKKINILLRQMGTPEDTPELPRAEGVCFIGDMYDLKKATIDVSATKWRFGNVYAEVFCECFEDEMDENEETTTEKFIVKLTDEAHYEKLYEKMPQLVTNMLVRGRNPTFEVASVMWGNVFYEDEVTKPVDLDLTEKCYEGTCSQCFTLTGECLGNSTDVIRATFEVDICNESMVMESDEIIVKFKNLDQFNASKKLKFQDIQTYVEGYFESEGFQVKSSLEFIEFSDDDDQTLTVEDLQ